MGCKMTKIEYEDCKMPEQTKVIKYERYPEKYIDKSLYEQINNAIGKNTTLTAILIVDPYDHSHKFYNVYVDGRTLTDEQLLNLVKLRRETNFNVNLKVIYEDFREIFYNPQSW